MASQERRWLKNEAPPELVETVRQLEERADACYEKLLLLKLPWNIAVWSLLVGSIKLVEQEIAARGDNTPHLDAALLNLSRYIPIAARWSVEHGRPVSKLATNRWTSALSRAVDEAIGAAHHYSAFLTCLPMWHKNRYLAEPISRKLVRFTSPGSGRHRQVSAHQKGFRPKGGTYKGERAARPEQTTRMQELFSKVFQSCQKTGMLRFQYRDPWDLWSELVPEYQSRMTAIVRRADLLSLGDYTLSDFKQFYAAFLAVCAAHEFLCFTWWKNYGLYPFDSSVVIRSRTNWVAILSKLSGIPADRCLAIVSDLTFDFSNSRDLHVHPFVPLDSWTTRLAVAPQFPLHSRPDENILRVCSTVRPTVFSSTSLEKEPEIKIGRASCRERV